MNVIVGDVFLGVVWDMLSHCGMVLCEVTGRRKYEKGCFLLCVAKYYKPTDFHAEFYPHYIPIVFTIIPTYNILMNGF